MKVWMVCLGNICRSPLAEEILKAKAEEKNLNWIVESAGTSGYHSGSKPDKRSIKVAEENGLDISMQRSRPFRGYDLEEFDLIYVMDSMNYQDVMKLVQSEDEKSKVKLIMNELEPGMNIAVPDPYYGEYGFENVYKMLDAACEKIIEKYQS